MTSKLKHLDSEEASEDGAMYLPANLVNRCDRPDEEFDVGVEASKTPSTNFPLDKGETSPTSVSHDISVSNMDRIEEKVMHHLTRPSSLELRRVESGSNRSTASKSSRASRSSSRSLSRDPKQSSNRPRRKRNDKLLEQMISETILSTESISSESTLSTKECSDSACRSAQFILTDLFHEAAKTMNGHALPYPFSHKSMLARHDPPGERSEAEGKAFPVSLPPRHPRSSLSSSGDQYEEQEEEVDYQDPEPDYDDDASQDDGSPMTSAQRALTSVDISSDFDPTSPQENEVQATGSDSPFYVFDMQQQNSNFALKHDNTLDAGSNSSAGESFFQYSSTNGTSSFSQMSKASPGVQLSQSESSLENTSQVQDEDQMKRELATDKVISLSDDAWTNFDTSPFEDDDGFGNAFGFDPFTPFDDAFTANEIAPAKFDTGVDIDPAWDTSRIIPGASLKSPASVFNFFTDDDDDGEEIALTASGNNFLDKISQMAVQDQDVSTTLDTTCSF